jgi:LuxR family maltose regulon positive regulatory protein
MPATLLASKLQVPPLRHKHISRPRLYQLLDKSGVRKLTLVSAPAGYGKSSLLTGWVRSTALDVRLAWLALDETDNAPERFWRYLLAAFDLLLFTDDTTTTLSDTLSDTMQGWLEDAHSSQNAPTDGTLTDGTLHAQLLVTRIVNALLDNPQERALVLDDYHLIQQPSIHHAISQLIDNAPPTFHFIISSRSEPNLPLSRFRARGELVEIRSHDLRFDGAEIERYLHDVMAVDLSKRDASTLEARTEGWIAGVQLAALSLPGKRNVSDFIETFTGTDRYVLDYLTEEVLMRQNDDTQSFLLFTSMLERLNAELCNAVTESRDGAKQLEALERKNLFIIPLDNQRTWYRYHAFFADLLRYRLEQARPDLLPVLHRRASLWFAAEGDLAEALHHALLAADRDLVRDIIDEHPKIEALTGLLRSWFGNSEDTLYRTGYGTKHSTDEYSMAGGHTNDSNTATDNGATDNGATDNGATDNGATNNGDIDRLLEQAFSQGISREQHNHLLATLEHNQSNRPTPSGITSLEALSEREHDVLTLIAAGYSNKAIAKRLDISLNTVKTHTKNINSKLNVSSRIQAAAKARDLGLIE